MDYLQGMIPDPRNLFKRCKTHKITNPSKLTLDEVRVELFICQQKLEELRPEAPQHWREHLNDCLAKATENDDTERMQAIKKVLEREASRKCWARVNRSSKKPSGQAPVAVGVETPDQGYEEFTTEDDVFLQVSKNLSERFRLAFTAPSCSGKLFDDIGFIGDTQAVKEILEGTYVLSKTLTLLQNFSLKKPQSHMQQCQKRKYQRTYQ